MLYSKARRRQIQRDIIDRSKQNPVDGEKIVPRKYILGGTTAPTFPPTQAGSGKLFGVRRAVVFSAVHSRYCAQSILAMNNVGQ